MNIEGHLLQPCY